MDDNPRPRKRVKIYGLPRFRISRVESQESSSSDSDSDVDTVMVVSDSSVNPFPSQSSSSSSTSSSTSSVTIKNENSIQENVSSLVESLNGSSNSRQIQASTSSSSSSLVTMAIDLSDRSQNADCETKENITMETVINDNDNRDAEDTDIFPPNFNFNSNTIKDRFAAVYNKNDYSDITFVVGPNNASSVRFPAHKVILGVASPVFNAMFNGLMASNDSEIVIPDVEPNAFKILLRYLYTDIIDLDQDIVMGTLYAAKKYAVTALEEDCVSFLKANLTGDNVFLILNQARLFDQTELEAACLKKIDKNTKELLDSESFLDLDHETLCWLLERDTLSVKEVDLFESVIKWAKHQCNKQNIPDDALNQREILGKALQLIRFPTMQPKEFSETVVDQHILNDNEVITIFRYLAAEPRPPISFPTKTRNPYSINNKLVLRRFDGISDPQPTVGCQEIKFVVDRPILLGGIGLFTAKYGPFKYQVYIDIKDCHTDQTLASHRSVVNCNGAPSTFRLWFKKPVKIKPKTIYEAAVISTNPRTYCGVRGKSTITLKLEDNENVTFQFFNSNDGKVYCPAHDGGQIPEFLFYI